MKTLVIFVANILLFSGCTVSQKVIRESNIRINLHKDDFILSDEVSGEAMVVKILAINWSQLFKKPKETAHISKYPIDPAEKTDLQTAIKNFNNKTVNYALYEMLHSNPGYDVVFYPAYETTVYKPLIIGFFYNKTIIKTKARLGRFVED